MKIVDRVYGSCKVDGVLEEIIHSSPFQRLKGIHQGGASYLVNNDWDVTRYEHSIGVMLLIRLLGGSIQEQIAGLLHDISHTAFSHVVDYVLRNVSEDYHEKIYERVVNASEIPTILRRYGFDYESVLFNDHQWTILERPAPDLCADRVDYTLRDLLRHGKLIQHEVDRFVESLDVVGGEICIKGLPMAEWFVGAYYKEVIDYFMDPLNVYGYEMLSRALRTALEKNLIVLDDFLDTDDIVIEKLTNAGNAEVHASLQALHKHVQVIETSPDDDYDIHQLKKVRLIDPPVVIDGCVYRASLLSDHVKKLTARANEKSLKGIFVKVC